MNTTPVTLFAKAAKFHNKRRKIASGVAPSRYGSVKEPLDQPASPADTILAMSIPGGTNQRIE
jgi:hypothetical protein